MRSRLSNGELEIEYAGGSDVIGGFDALEAITTASLIRVTPQIHILQAQFQLRFLLQVVTLPDALKSSGVVDAYSQVVMKQRGVKVLGCPLLELDMSSKCVANRVSCLILRGKNPIHTTYDPILECWA